MSYSSASKSYICRLQTPLCVLLMLLLSGCISLPKNSYTSSYKAQKIVPMVGATPTVPLVQAQRVCELEGKAAGEEMEIVNSIKNSEKVSGAAAGLLRGLSNGLSVKRAKADATELCLAKYGYNYQ